jgi:hypothetical protein
MSRRSPDSDVKRARRSHKTGLMRTRWFVVAALAACSAPRPPTGGAGEVVLSVDGKIAGGPARFGASDLASLPRRSVRARDPRGGAEASYEGISLARLLGEELEIRRGADVAIVRGKGGYEVAIPIAVLRQHRPVLADRIGGVAVAQARPGAEPLVLAWPTVESPGLQYDPRARWWWVDGVSNVEVATWLQGYGRALRVPPGAADDARAGAEAFQTSCMQCHRLRGAGGARGPELTDRLADAGAREGFADALRGHAARPDAAPIADLGQTVVGQIAAFLTAVAMSGPAQPQDEPPPEPTPRPPGPGTQPVAPPYGLVPAEQAREYAAAREQPSDAAAETRSWGGPPAPPQPGRAGTRAAKPLG